MARLSLGSLQWDPTAQTVRWKSRLISAFICAASLISWLDSRPAWCQSGHQMWLDTVKKNAWQKIMGCKLLKPNFFPLISFDKKNRIDCRIEMSFWGVIVKPPAETKKNLHLFITDSPILLNEEVKSHSMPVTVTVIVIDSIFLELFADLLTTERCFQYLG